MSLATNSNEDVSPEEESKIEEASNSLHVIDKAVPSSSTLLHSPNTLAMKKKKKKAAIGERKLSAVSKMYDIDGKMKYLC